MKFLTARGLTAQRKALGGRFDKADLEILDLPDIVIEAKNRRARQRPGEAPSEKSALAEWVDEAVQEARNVSSAAIGVVWHHRYRASSPGDGYVTMQGDDFVTLLRELRTLREKVRLVAAMHRGEVVVTAEQAKVILEGVDGVSR